MDTYYESCKICLCEKCCKEHHHYVEKEKPHTFNSQDLNNFVVKINENKKTEKCIKKIFLIRIKKANFISQKSLFQKFTQKILKKFKKIIYFVHRIYY